MGLSTWADRASSCNITAESCTAAMTARIRHDDELSVFVGNFALASSLCNQGRTWLIGETKRWREISGDGGGRVLDQDGERRALELPDAVGIHWGQMCKNCKNSLHGQREMHTIGTRRTVCRREHGQIITDWTTNALLRRGASIIRINSTS